MTIRSMATRLAHPVQLLLLVGLIATTGCTAYTLSSLQRDFKELEVTRDACRQDAINTGAAGLCLSGYDAPMLDLAIKTRDAAPQAEDERTRISFLALAATAGWKSRTEQGMSLSEAVAADGNERCQNLAKDKFGVPRDCALLQLAPPFVRHGRALNFLATIEHVDALTPDQRKELVDQSGNYITNTWGIIEGIRGKLAADPEVSKSVITFLEEERAIIYCTAMKISERDQNFGDAELSATVSHEVRDKITPAFNGKIPVCGTGVPDPI